MDALVIRCAVLALAVSSMGASFRTPNFIVEAPTPQMAEQIGQAAEKFRHELAIDWLGKPMPNWSQPCPIQATVGQNLGAGGATSFVFEHGEVYGWTMTIQGSLERILDSVLPHEVTHTIFATHFRRPLPRWADEGACTTVEHVSEREKQQRLLIEFLHTNRGISFSKMFAMREYPRDVMPLYSQGFSLARFLISQGGKRKYLNYVADGMADENWSRATKKFYGFDNLLALQNNWLEWVKQGSPELGNRIDSPALAAVDVAPPTGAGVEPLKAVKRTEAFPPEQGPVGVAQADVDNRSVYDRTLASDTRNLGVSQGPSAEDQLKWKSPSAIADALPEANSVAMTTIPSQSRIAPEDLPGPTHQVTRPQELQRPRQVILEWSRPPGATSASRPLPGPL